jgi:hypothetical protein
VALTARLDVTLARAQGSLTVALGPVVAVYGLDLVEASSAIYVIHPVCVAGVDKVVARAGEYVVVAFSGDDLVVAGAAFDLVIPAATREEVVPAITFDLVIPTSTLEAVVHVGPEERILASGTGEDLRKGLVPAKSAPTVTTITVSKMYRRCIRLPFL